jgi:hypothetical protein
MKNTVRYYTSTRTLNYLASCFVFIGIVLLIYVGNGIIADGCMIVFQGVFFTIQTHYIFWGIKDKNESRLKWMSIVLMIMAVLYLIDPMAKEIIVLIVAAALIIYYGICYLVGKMNGDNLVRKDDIVDYLYFSYINEKMAAMNVSFPLDMARSFMKEGKIKKAGKMLSGKYTGEIVFLISRGDFYYICPVKEVYPLESLEENADGIMAGTEEMAIKIWNFEKGQYTGYFSVITR